VGNARMLEHDGHEAPSEDDFTIMPPVYIPATVQIGKDAIIGPYVSMGERCIVGRTARVADAVILGGAAISEGAEIDRAIVDVDGSVYSAATE